MTDRPPAAPPWLVWFIIVLAMIVAGSLFTVILARQLRHENHRLATLRARAQTCPERSVGPDDDALDPGGAPASQPLGERPYLEDGVDIRPLLRLRLERVRPGGFDHVRVGSAEVLAPKSIHVISLWATWCGACKQLLPELQTLFTRRAGDWKDAVRFVPVQVLDPAAPDLAFARWRHIMPPSRVQLADRTRDEFVKLLGEDTRRLYRGHLPVTLVLDCNRRVRWARLGRLDEHDFADLEHRLDQFVTESRTGSRPCDEVWCGNGRCEAGETHCVDDCGPAEPTPIVIPVSVPIEADAAPPAPGPVPCPEGCRRCDEQGRCHALWDEPPRAPVKPIEPTRCGDGICGSDEANCCLDCGCEAPLVCRMDATGQHSCQSPALWGSPG